MLFASDGDKVMVGDPLIKGAKVIARVNNHGRGEKIIVFRYKNKVRYSNKLGHRQGFTSLTINEIELPEEKAKATKKTPKQKVEENQDGA